MRLSTKFLNELGRHNYVTPTSYLELINSFKNLLQNKQDEISKAKRRYVVIISTNLFIQMAIKYFQSQLKFSLVNQTYSSTQNDIIITYLSIT
jgi:dynein heavy chain